MRWLFLSALLALAAGACTPFVGRPADGGMDASADACAVDAATGCEP